MNVHTVTGRTIDWFWHKCRCFSVFHRCVMNDIFDHHGVVSHLGHLTKLWFDFKLTFCTNFRMMIFDWNTDFFHFKAHLRTAFIGNVKWFCDMIGFLMRYDTAFTFHITVPWCLINVHCHSDCVWIYCPADFIEKIEFEFGENKHCIRDTCILHVFFCS